MRSDHLALEAKRLAYIFQLLPQRGEARSANLEGFAERMRIFKCCCDDGREVFDENGLKASLRAAERNHREALRQRGRTNSRSDHRARTPRRGAISWSGSGGLGGVDLALAFRFRAQIGAWCIERAFSALTCNRRLTPLTAGVDDLARQLDVVAIERLAASCRTPTRLMTASTGAIRRFSVSVSCTSAFRHRP